MLIVVDLEQLKLYYSCSNNYTAEDIGLGTDNDRFSERKKILEDHLKKYHTLRKQGKIKEAMEQYSKTIEYARNSITQSLEVLDKSMSKIKSLDPTKQARINEIASDTASLIGNRNIIKDLIKDSIFYRSMD